MEKIPEKVLLAFQRASLGEIYPEIRCIALGYSSDKKLTIRYYLDREIQEIDEDRLSELMTEMLADMEPTEILDTSEECIYTLEPIRALDNLGGFVYARMENR